MRSWCSACPGVAIAAVCISLVALLAAPQPATAGQGGAVPRTTDGKPDLSGIWQVLNTAAWDVQDHAASLGVPAGQGVVEGNEIPYQPWALAKNRLLRGLLFEIDPLDPVSILIAALLLVGVSALASYMPARRAVGVNPIATLRAN